MSKKPGATPNTSQKQVAPAASKPQATTKKQEAPLTYETDRRPGWECYGPQEPLKKTAAGQGKPEEKRKK